MSIIIVVINLRKKAILWVPVYSTISCLEIICFYSYFILILKIMNISIYNPINVIV